eukprot:2579131-Heterocapsa_arctica.AAC.1
MKVAVAEIPSDQIRSDRTHVSQTYLARLASLSGSYLYLARLALALQALPKQSWCARRSRTSRHLQPRPRPRPRARAE